MSCQPRVVLCGPSAWNHLIDLDRLPEPVPHMQFARQAWHTIGGTSAGKALHLASVGVDVHLWTPIGPDADGRRVEALLTSAGVAVEPVASDTTERHVNLMAGDGRVSLYVASPTPPPQAAVSAAATAVLEAALAVIDLSELGQAVILALPVEHPPLWSDLHDYDGSSAYHEAFVRRSSVVFMNDDATGDPWGLMASCLDRGPELAVCTLGARGAVALERDGTRHEVAAAPAEAIDTNGAGDAFMAGFLAARLGGAGIDDALSSAALQAAVAIGSRHLHPVLDREPAAD